MNLCSKPLLKSIFGVHVLRPHYRNARKRKAWRNAAALLRETLMEMLMEAKPSGDGRKWWFTLQILSGVGWVLSQGQGAAATHGWLLCTDDRRSSWQGAKHHKQGPLMESSLARFDSNNWDHDFSRLKSFCAYEGLRRCLLDSCLRWCSL